jgi:hypothetical protein
MRTIALLATLTMLAVPTYAEPTVDAFSRCLAESTTGKDRKDFARWLFVSMGAHPSMREISRITPEAAEDASRNAGLLLTKLLADSCPKEAQAAFKAVGAAAMQSAFGVVGQLAMQELMTDKDVAAGMSILEKYLDSQRIQAAIGAK